MEMTESAVSLFWADVAPAALEIVRAMDAIDVWAVDGDPRIAALVERYASAITAEGVSRSPELPMLRFLGLVRSSRSLRFMAGIGNQDAALLMRWTEYALKVLEGSDVYSELDRALAMVFVSRLQAVRQQLLLASIFSPDALYRSSVLIARQRAAGVIP